MRRNVVIVGAGRTAIGTLNGVFAHTPAHELSAHVIKGLLEKSHITPSRINEVILGHVLSAAEGQNPGRQAALKAGIPVETPAWEVNQVCGSGLLSVILGAQHIILGDRDVVIAGGHESMSLAPHAAHQRSGIKMGNITLVDTMIKDGLWDPFHDYHMGITAENVARQYSISRAKQDQFGALSQNKAEQAQKSGFFDEEIIPISVQTGKTETLITHDEGIRYGSTPEILGKLRPAFLPDGTVTAGNASGLNDGAAVLILAEESLALENHWPILARIVSWDVAGVAPEVMGLGPIPASRQALKRAGWSVEDLDLIEVNEAFAAQTLAVNQEMKWDPARVNVNGGAIALGHPIGASGARILVTLLHEMKRRQVARGLATLCVGGGMGTTLCVERVSSL
jgi:acetyl-CoA C-acetyltransferase